MPFSTSRTRELTQQPQVTHLCLSVASVAAAHRYLPLQRDRFLVVGIDRDGAQRVLARFAAVAAFEKDLAEQNVRVDEFRVPEDSRFQRRDRCFLIAATQV